MAASTPPLRVVVTGASGNVGRSVVGALIADDRIGSVVGAARRPADSDEEPYADAKLEWKNVDVGTHPLDDLLAGADAVIHLAWRFQPTRRRTVTWQANVVGTRRVMVAAADAGVGVLVHASSVGAYSPPSRAELRDVPVTETHPTDALPTAAYGTQKSYLERSLDGFELAHPEMRVVRVRSAFVFQRPAAPSQRRIFAGPFAPGRLIGSRRIPVVPVPRGLRFQAVHADDLAQAYLACVVSDAAGAFNIAASDVIDRAVLERLLRARSVEVGERLVRSALAAAYRCRLVPAEPGLFELFMSLPLMDTTRATEELGWHARHTGAEAVSELLDGLAQPTGARTAPLDPHAGGPLRVEELRTASSE